MKMNNHLEEKIKRTLENLEASPKAGSWEQFEQRLDAAAPPAVESLDDLIVSRLAPLEAPLAPSSWDMFERRIEVEEAAEIIENEAAIDNLAYENLSNLQARYQSQHWDLMAKRLNEEFSLRHRLYRYKVVEMAFLALLLLTVYRYLPVIENAFDKQPSGNRQHEQIQAAPPAGNDSKPVEESKAAGTPIASATQDASNDSNASEENKAAGTSTASNAQNAGTVFPKATNIAFENSLTDANRPPSTVHRPPSTVSKTIDANWQDLLSANEIAAEELSKYQPLPAPDFLAMNGKFALLPEPAPEFKLSKLGPLKARNQLRFSLFATTDYNYVHSPAGSLDVIDTLIKTEYYTTGASGYGGGILVSLKKDRWEFQSGGVYSFKRYIPNIPTYWFNTVKYYVVEDFHGVQQDLLQVPLNALYHFKNEGLWRFYAMGGASAHFITSSVYEIHYQRTLAINAPNIPSSPDDERSIRDEIELPEGVLDGGKLYGNLYVTGNLGLGIERYLTPRWSVFVQPNYQHFFSANGVGVNKDKINTFSLYLGAKVNLR